MLANRARAVRDGDRMAFLATVGSAPAAFQDAQSRVYGNLRKLPLEGWRERLVDTEAMDGATAVVRVEVRYRLRGFDRGDVARTRYLTLAPRAGTWTIVGDGTSRGLADDTDIWDCGPLAVVRGRSGLVIGDGAASAASPNGWTPPSRSSRPWSARRGRSGSSRSSPPTRPSPPRSRPRAEPRPDRRARHRGARRRGRPRRGPRHRLPRHLRPPQRARPRRRAHPRADPRRHRRRPRPAHPAVADRGLRGLRRLPARQDQHPDGGGRAAPRGLRRARAVRAPRRRRLRRRLPRLSQAYQEAWLACRMVADRYGEAALVRLYRAAGRAPEAAALRDVLGLTRERFTALWRDYVKEELA
ncbi:hypothetical protein ACFQY7_00415 [Actinomadura luteofluorescens]|uniref:hypothetical protein n=1 Tax=Actinomadura luteofluorescens TaxID=46163 RepID=UPI003636E415